MESGNQGRPNFPGRPSPSPFAAASPQSSGSDGAGFRPTLPAGPLSAPPPYGPQTSGFRSAPPVGVSDPSMMTHAGQFLHFPATQLPPSHIGRPPTQIPFRPQTPMGPLPLPPTSVEPPFSAPRPIFQPILPGYPNQQANAVSQAPSMPFYPNQQTNAVSQAPPMPFYPNQQTSAVSQAPPMPFSSSVAQASSLPPPPVTSAFPAQQRGFVQPPTVSAPFNLHARDQAQHPGYAPVANAVQGLVEDFSALSFASVPGSIEPSLDPKALPRPLDDDEEPNSFAKLHPVNCNSRYLRFTTNALPNSQSLASRWHLPLGAVVCPIADAPKGEEVSLLDFSSTGIIRCRRCRTYVNPYVSFTDSGRKWRCNICSLLNDVPGEYFAHLNASGQRVDLDQRPELTKGSVEFIAPTEYMVRPPMPPIYFFLIDVSMSAIRSGMLEVVSQTIKSCLDELPGYPRTQIGFITYDSTVHFYNMKSSLTQPQMMVVSDLDDIFVPLPDDLLVNLSESRSVVETFLESLPSMFLDNSNVESAFGPALRAAFMVMSQLGGKLLIFQNTLPSLGVGRLKLRGDNLRIYGTDKEHTLRIPEDPFYKQMAADFTKFQIGINIYAFSDKYTDVASLGALAKYTGGQVYYYPGFQSIIHGEKLRHELARDLTRETAWEAVMRIRCGKGVRFTSYHGNFMLRSTDLLALPAVDCDKAYAMQLSLEETLLTTQTVYFQVALLYTSSCGERRIRVHTAAVPVVADLGEMYRQADTGAIVSLFARLAIEKTLSSKLEDARNSVQQRIVKSLREYRNLHAVQHRLGSRLIYPEALKLLPLYGLALCRSTPLRGGYADAQLDERCAAGFTMMALPVKRLLKLLYPSLIRVDEYLLKTSAENIDFKNISKRLPLASDSMDSRGLYVYDDGFHFVLWFGQMLSLDVARNLLGADFAAELSRVVLAEQENEMSRKLIGALRILRNSDPSYYQIPYLVRQGENPREGYLLLKNLVEDQIGGAPGYIDWIRQIHRQVQQNA